jgi:hypothetical protein
MSGASRREVLVGAVGIAAVACDERGAGWVGEDTPVIPAITPNDEHYVTSCCGTPTVDAATWTLQLLDRGVPLVSLDLAALDALPTGDKEHTLECIGAGPRAQRISNAVWTGLPLRDVLAGLGVVVDPDVVALKWTCADGYSSALPVADLDLPVWLVWRMNGAPIPPEHGFPVRVIVPGRYGMKNPKWVVSLELVDAAYAGFWESRGWSEEAVYRPNTFIRHPAEDEALAAGVVRVAGTAYAGSDPVVAVDVRVDGGPWWPATLEYAPGVPDVWCLWSFTTFLLPGQRTVEARCTTASGQQSVPSEEVVRDLTGYNGSMSVTWRVG